MPLPVTLTWLLWLAAISVWMEAVLPPPPPPTMSAQVIDLQQWKLAHANQNGRWSA